MTFKHTKFDSPTLRALEKIAVEKGLVKPAPLEKKAATKKADYTPTPDLMENILKLCAGLRAKGLTKQAAEVETAFLNYKQAQTLYETSKEKGEDLIQAAHPKGSHKLEGVDGEEATVEDIIEQQLKMMKVVEKKPTGKLASSKSILNAVKVVLAEEVAPAQTEEEISRQINELAGKVLTSFNGLMARIKTYGGEGFDSAKADQYASAIIGALSKRPITRQQVNIIADNWKNLIAFAKTSGKFGGGFGHSLVPWQTDEETAGKQNWDSNVNAFAVSVRNELNKLAPLVKDRDTIQFMKDQGTYQGPGSPALDSDNPEGTQRQGVTTVMSREAVNITAIANGALADLTRWQGWINLKKSSMKPADYNSAIAWLKEQYGKIDGLKKQFMEMSNDPERQNREAREFTNILNALIAENKEFREAWFQ